MHSPEAALIPSSPAVSPASRAWPLSPPERVLDTDTATQRTPQHPEPHADDEDIAVYLDHQRRILLCETLIESAFGYSSISLLGTPWSILFTEHAQDRLNQAFAELDGLAHPRRIEFSDATLSARHADGSEFHVTVSLASVYRDQRSGYTLRIRTHTSHPAEPVLDRGAVLDHLSRQLRRHRHLNQCCALLHIRITPPSPDVHDLDPKTCRQYLHDCTTRLERSCRAQDPLLPLAPFEFAVLLEDIFGDLHTRGIITRILSCLSAPVTVQGRALPVHARVGSAHYPDQALDAATLLQCAALGN